MVNVPLVAIGVHGVFITALAVFVSYTRNATRDGKAPNTATWMHQVIRAHGQSTEWVPYLCITYLYYATQPQKLTSTTSALIVGSTVARVMNAVGLLTGTVEMTASPSVLRQIGAVSTFGCTAALAVGLITDGL